MDCTMECFFILVVKVLLSVSASHTHTHTAALCLLSRETSGSATKPAWSGQPTHHLRHSCPFSVFVLLPPLSPAPLLCRRSCKSGGFMSWPSNCWKGGHLWEPSQQQTHTCTHTAYSEPEPRERVQRAVVRPVHCYCSSLFSPGSAPPPPSFLFSFHFPSSCLLHLFPLFCP